MYESLSLEDIISTIKLYTFVDTSCTCIRPISLLISLSSVFFLTDY